MRPRLRARVASTRVGSSRNAILLATEESYPSVGGDHADWCDALVHGLPQYDFVLWSLSASPGSGSPYRLPSNAVRWIDVSWSRTGGRPPGPVTAEAPRPPPGDHDVEREFLPALRGFLDAAVDPAGPGARVLESMLRLRSFLRRWDADATWRSKATTTAVLDRLESRTGNRGPGAGAAAPEGDASARDPTERDAADAATWLSWVLAALAMEVPAADLVHVTAPGFCALPGVLAKAERGTPLLLTELATPRRDRALGLDPATASSDVFRFASEVEWAVARTCSLLADRVVLVSPTIEPPGRAPGVRVDVVPAGLDERVFRSLRVARSDRPTVVQVSRIEPRSDLLTMLRVADLVRREIPDVRFVHHGDVVDEAYWAQVRNLHRDLLLGDTVRFEGPAADLPRALAIADVVLGTSLEEAFPWALVAALLCERPAVAADPGGIRQVIDGAGITAPPGDAVALAEAVSVTLRISPEQRAAIGRAGRDRALSRFRRSVFLDAYRAVYRELIGGARTERRRPEPEPTDAEEAVVRADAGAGTRAREGTDAGVRTDVGIGSGPGGLERRRAGADAGAGMAPGGVERRRAGPEARRAPWSGQAEGAAGAPFSEAPGAVAGLGVDPTGRLSDPDPMARVTALSLLGAPEEAEFAVAALADPYPEVRREAVRAIGRLGGPQAGRWLVDTVAHDPSAEVREEAVAALAELLARPQADERPA
jgi:polysaccharide biosynthesis protein PelF